MRKQKHNQRKEKPCRNGVEEPELFQKKTKQKTLDYAAACEPLTISAILWIIEERHLDGGEKGNI